MEIIAAKVFEKIRETAFLRDSSLPRRSRSRGKYSRSRSYRNYRRSLSRCSAGSTCSQHGFYERRRRYSRDRRTYRSRSRVVLRRSYSRSRSGSIFSERHFRRSEMPGMSRDARVHASLPSGKKEEEGGKDVAEAAKNNNKDALAPPPPSTEKGVEAETTAKGFIDNKTSGNKTQESELPEDMISLLGEKLPKETVKNLSLVPGLAHFWEKFLSKALAKSDREKIVADFDSLKIDCFEAPILNDEFAALLYDTALKRDQHIFVDQVSISVALKAMGNIITKIFHDEAARVNFSQPLQLLWNSAKLLVDVFRQLTVGRRSYIIGAVKDKYRRMLEKTKAGRYLFGDNLAEKFKYVNDMERLGTQVIPQRNQGKGQNLNSNGLPQNNSSHSRGNQRQAGSSRNNQQHRNQHHQSSRKSTKRPSAYHHRKDAQEYKKK